MGCTGSTVAGALHGDIANATRQYFGLGDFPLKMRAAVSKSAFPSPGEETLVVSAVGLNQPCLLGVLEDGFLRRDFWIRDATINTQDGLFRGIFELRGMETVAAVKHDSGDSLRQPLSNIEINLFTEDVLSGPEVPNRCDNVPQLSQVQVRSPKRSTTVRRSISSMTDVRTKTATELAGVDRRAAEMGAVMRATMYHDWSPGVRIALYRTLEAAGLTILMARLSIAEERQKCIKDTCWLAIARGSTAWTNAAGDEAAGPNVATVDGCRDCPAWIARLIEDLKSVTYRDKSAGTAPVPAPESPRQLSVRGVVETLQETSKSLLAKRLASVPCVLHEKAKVLSYSLRPASWGVQFPGASKYAGAGLSTNFRGAEVLEFSSFFIPSAGRGSSIQRRLQSLWKAEEGSAEFVTQYNVAERCLTICKAFLNGVLPSGESAGTRAMAEQLLKVPVLDASGAEWDGAAMTRNLRRIVLCDVVNWNTYAIMSMVGRAPAAGVEAWLIESECRACGLKSRDLMNMPVTEIFAKTSLGRVVHGILKIWAQSGVVRHEVSKVVATFEDSSKFEVINGEHRHMLDIVVTLRATEAPQKPFFFPRAAAQFLSSEEEQRLGAEDEEVIIRV